MADEEKPGILAKYKRLAKDGWSNLITGLNGFKTAKKRHTHHVFDGLLADHELESLFVEDGLAARIVKLLPDDMYREGWEYEFPEIDELKAAEYSEAYAAIFEGISAVTKMKEAAYWNRLKGGAAILISVIDGMDMRAPLMPKKIRTFEKLKVLDRTGIDFINIQFQNDPTQPRYGLLVLYPVKFDIGRGIEGTQLVHFSRVIELHGDTLPKDSATSLSPERRFWGISVLQRAEDRLKTLGSSLGSIDQLLEEMSVGKHKIKNLANLLSSPEGKAAIQLRVELNDLTRSVFRSMYLDAGDEGGKGAEDFVRDTVNFTGVPEILYIIFMLLSADTGYPITRLFGVSPGGMNATGESDMRNYYDGVRSAQTTEMLPMVLRIARIIHEWRNIPEPYIKFLPLQTMNEKEQAELDKLNVDKDKLEADTYKVYVDMGALEPYEVRFLKFGNTLDNIPVPQDLELPPVETAPGGGEPEDEPPAEEDPDAPDNDAEGGKPKPSKRKAAKK
jgi:phage-related protein (TIGR01555 family)